jgi:hypothetical protein
MAHTNTDKNPSTRGFTDLQFARSVSYVPRPRHRFTKFQKVMFAIGIALLAYAGTYLVVRLFAW